MDLIFTQVDMVEERFAGHAIVALGVIGRDGAFVHKEEVKLRPGHARQEWVSRVGQQSEGNFGC